MDAGDETRSDGAARNGRLEAVAALVPPGSRVADIGTGHGLLAHGLLVSGRSPHCIVTERTELLLSGVRTYPASHPLAGSLELRAGDGLAALRPDDRVDVVVAAGMGGPSILGILERSPLPCSAFARFVFQPQTDPAGLRRGLLDLGLAIVAECLVRERGRFYLALAAEAQADAVLPTWPGLRREDVLEAGPCLLREGHPLLVPYWQRQVQRLERIQERASRGAAGRVAQQRLDQARRILDFCPRLTANRGLL